MLIQFIQVQLNYFNQIDLRTTRQHKRRVITIYSLIRVKWPMLSFLVSQSVDVSRVFIGFIIPDSTHHCIYDYDQRQQTIGHINGVNLPERAPLSYGRP